MHGCWRYPLVEDAADHNLIRALLEHCRKIGLPVVLWFRETPGNYGRFSWLCGLADVTYVADPSLLESVRTEHPGARAEYLPPAIQPRVNNPLRPIDSSRHPMLWATRSSLTVGGTSMGISRAWTH
jgi:hypothetical protein